MVYFSNKEKRKKKKKRKELISPKGKSEHYSKGLKALA